MAVSPKGEAFFPNLFNPSPRTNKYDIMLRFTPDEMDKEDKAAFDALVDQAKQIAKDDFDKTLADVKNPITRGSEDDKYLNDPNSIYVRFGTTGRVAVVGPNPTVHLEPEEVYGGMIARVSYNMKSYDKNGNRGITVYLNSVQKVSDGERKGQTRLAPEQEFGDVSDEQAADLFR